MRRGKHRRGQRVDFTAQARRRAMRAIPRAWAALVARRLLSRLGLTERDVVLRAPWKEPPAPPRSQPRDRTGQSGIHEFRRMPPMAS